MSDSIESFLEHWANADIGKVFKLIKLDYHNHIEAGYLRYVTKDELPLHIGDCKTSEVTASGCDNNYYVKITKLGENILMFDEL